MKNIKLLSVLALLVSNALFAQNVPTGATSVGGSVTNSDLSAGPAPFSFSGTPLFNTVKKYTPYIPVSDESLINDSYLPTYIQEQTTYQDGFGRKMEEIYRGGGEGNDLIKPFDNRCNVSKFDYLPYPGTFNDNSFKTNTYVDQSAYYAGVFPNDAGTARKETSYISDAFSRSTLFYNAGKSNVGQRNGVQVTANYNSATEVIKWDLDPVHGWPLKNGHYAAGTLIKKATINADGGHIVEYYDNDNKLVAKMVLSENKLCTSVKYGGEITASVYHQAWPTTEPVSVSSSYLGLSPYSVATDQAVASDNFSRDLNEVNSPWSFPSWGIPTEANNSSVNNVNVIYVSPSIAYCPVYLLTYYVYDIYDRLTFTLHPKAVQYLEKNSWVCTTDIVNNLCDFVSYDDLGRKFATHQAGEQDSNLFIFDSHDRVALYKKPNAGGTWQWNHYDQLNRIIETGDFTTSTSRWVLQHSFDIQSLPSALDGSSKLMPFLFYEAIQGLRSGVPLTGANVHSYNYYDDYSEISSGYFDGTTSVPLSFSYSPTIFGTGVSTSIEAISIPTVKSKKTRGLLIASVSKTIDATSTVTLQPFSSYANFYDDNGNMIQKVCKNVFGGTDYIGYQYNFKGQVLYDVGFYNNPSSTDPPARIEKLYLYSAHTKGLTSTRQMLNGSTPRLLSSNFYNSLGQINRKSIGGLENQYLTYNIRGQLIGINAKFAETGTEGSSGVMKFGESIKYDYGFSHNLFCGGITGILWRNIGDPEQAYGYTYDMAGRLLQADYREFYTSGGTPSWTTSHMDYTENNILYDLNGNITSLYRYGPKTTGPGLIDKLTYVYETSDVSNRLERVDDAILTGSTSHIDYDFKDRGTGTDYGYDLNGNLSSDLNKQTSTQYFYFDKPQQLSFTSGDYYKYAYDYLGNKIEDKLFKTSGITTTDFLGPVVYSNNSIAQIRNEEGFCVKSGSGFDYYYFVKDHLGNVRSTMRAEAYLETPETFPGPVGFAYHATHETGAATTEEAMFYNIANVRDNKPESIDEGDLKAARLNASDTLRTVGTTLILKVMAGDSIDIAAKSYYSSTDTATGSITPEQLANSFISTLVNGSGASGSEGGSGILGKLFTPDNLSIYNAASAGPVDTAVPMAFVNYISYDEEFNVIAESSGRMQIGAGPNGWRLVGLDGGLRVDHSGWVVVDISTASSRDVYFDDLVATHYKGVLMDVNHYYPYGLPVMLSTASSTHPDNPYLFQTKKQDKTDGLYLHDFGARQYDPQLGRFISIDADNQYPSGYIGMGNNPVLLVDPTGNTSEVKDKPASDPQNLTDGPGPGGTEGITLTNIVTGATINTNGYRADLLTQGDVYQDGAGNLYVVKGGVVSPQLVQIPGLNRSTFKSSAANNSGLIVGDVLGAGLSFNVALNSIFGGVNGSISFARGFDGEWYVFVTSGVTCNKFKLSDVSSMAGASATVNGFVLAKANSTATMDDAVSGYSSGISYGGGAGEYLQAGYSLGNNAKTQDQTDNLRPMVHQIYVGWGAGVGSGVSVQVQNYSQMLYTSKKK